MNKKGFTLIELLVTIVIIAIIMGIVFPSAIKISNDNKDKMYEEYEKMMVEYALASDKKGDNIILLNELDGLDKIIKDCQNGYVFKTNTSPLEYKAYIKCEQYRTTGYSDVIAP